MSNENGSIQNLCDNTLNCFESHRLLRILQIFGSDSVTVFDNFVHGLDEGRIDHLPAHVNQGNLSSGKFNVRLDSLFEAYAIIEVVPPIPTPTQRTDIATILRLVRSVYAVYKTAVAPDLRA